MKKITTKQAGWGLFSAVFLSAALTFPMLAQTATDQKHNAVWKAKAEAMEAKATQAEYVFVTSLRPMYNMSSAKRDVVLTQDLMQHTELKARSASTMEEHHCLSEAIYYEARSEPVSGQLAVAEVVLNRIDSKHYPNSICGVVYEGSHLPTGCQFTFTCDGSLEKAPYGRLWEQSRQVAQMTMVGGVTPFTDRSTHYHTVNVTPHWSDNMRMTKQIGSHLFYRFAPRDYTVSTPLLRVAPPT